MANTKTATKRARQAVVRQERNQNIRSTTRTSVRAALEAIKTKDALKAKAAFQYAVKTISKAASKGAIPKGRASRKISRLTLLLKRSVPTALSAQK